MLRLDATSVDLDTRTVWRGEVSEPLPAKEAAVLR